MNLKRNPASHSNFIPGAFGSKGSEVLGPFFNLHPPSRQRLGSATQRLFTWTLARLGYVLEIAAQNAMFSVGGSGSERKP